MDTRLPTLVSVRLRAAADGRAGKGLRAEAEKGKRPVMQKVLISGSAGFIGGYVVEELLAKGYSVVGVDNFSKYGKVAKSYDAHPNYRLVEGDCQDAGLLTELLYDCEHLNQGLAAIPAD